MLLVVSGLGFPVRFAVISLGVCAPCCQWARLSIALCCDQSCRLCSLLSVGSVGSAGTVKRRVPLSRSLPISQLLTKSLVALPDEALHQPYLALWGTLCDAMARQVRLPSFTYPQAPHCLPTPCFSHASFCFPVVCAAGKLSKWRVLVCTPNADR